MRLSVVISLNLALAISGASLGATPLAAAPVSFQEALGALVAADVERAKGDIAKEKATEEVSQAKQGFLPTVSGTAGIRRRAVSDGPKADLHSAGVEAVLNLYRFGRDDAALTAAKARLEAAGYDVETLGLEAELQGSELLFDAIAATQLLAIEERFLEVKNASLELARRLYSKGVRPSQDVEKLSLDVAGEEVRVRDLKLRVARAESRLSQIAGRPLTVAADWPWQQQLVAANVTVPAAAAATRTDVRAAEGRVRAAEAGVAATRSLLYPSLDLGADYQWLRDPDLDATTRQWTASLTLTVPLYNRGTDYYGYRSQVAAARSLALDAQSVRQAAVAETTEASQALSVSLEGIKARAGIRDRAKALYDQSIQAFQKGLLSVNDLTADQSRYLQAESDTIDAWAIAHRALAQYCRVSGLTLADCVGRL